jgi:LmbE family N-acetylglucosaminyl deacetylase
MNGYRLQADPERPLEVLCLGAHCDDIEIGCGGALLQLCKSRKARVTWSVFSSNPEREAESRAAADLLLKDAIEKQVIFHGFRDGFLPYEGYKVKEAFESLKRLPRPDLILTHTRYDMHQDHRMVWELTWNTFRNHDILEYEIPKWDGDLGQPNVFIPLDEGEAQEKCRCLQQAFPSQLSRSWFKDETFLGLMRLRGMESNAASGYAEAFYGRKVVLGWGE